LSVNVENEYYSINCDYRIIEVKEENNEFLRLLLQFLKKLVLIFKIFGRDKRYLKAIKLPKKEIYEKV